MEKVIVMFAALLMAVNSMAQSKTVEPKDKKMVEFISGLISKDKKNFGNSDLRLTDINRKDRRFEGRSW